MAGADNKLTEEEVLGLAIRRVRERHHVSQRAVERSAGFGRGALSKIELGERHVLWGTLRRLAKGIGVELPIIWKEVEKIERMEREG